jgi:DNA-binding XRE family transcriptional regulator
MWELKYLDQFDDSASGSCDREERSTRVSGRKSFANLKREVEANTERRARLDRERQFVHAILGLTAMREARGATQRQVAEAWNVSQANVSQIEHTPDIYLSTLGKYVAALGGQIEIRAVFPDEVITLVGGGIRVRP